jgi:hypothetical protein
MSEWEKCHKMSYNTLHWLGGINHESCSIPKLEAAHCFENVNTHTGWHITNNVCQYCINCISTPAFRRKASHVFPFFLKVKQVTAMFYIKAFLQLCHCNLPYNSTHKWILHQQSPNAWKLFSNATRFEFHRSDRRPENQTVPYKCLAHKETISKHMISRPCSAVFRNKVPGFQHISAKRSIEML